MTTVLVGGRPDTTRSSTCLQPFVDACLERGVARVGLLLAGAADNARMFAPDYTNLLPALAGRIDVVPLADGVPDVARFEALVVGGGPTPAYHSALRPVYPEIRAMAAVGCPYLGFSAGAMIAGDRALVGGHRVDGVDVCPVGWSEGLDEVSLDEGIGLVPGVVEVHAAQAGTVGRAVAIVLQRGAEVVVALDEDTAVRPRGQQWDVLGTGRAWRVSADDRGRAVVDPVRAGGVIPVPAPDHTRY